VNFNRRELFASMGAAAAGYVLLADTIAAENSPAAQVGDRTTSLRIMRMDWKVDAEGYVGLPDGPGLGIEVDEPTLEVEGKKPQVYRWPGRTLKDGSVADY
jgi:L-alanine-DL-glutamate epimerase-like enolase superfamily enzyme